MQKMTTLRTRDDGCRNGVARVQPDSGRCWIYWHDNRCIKLEYWVGSRTKLLMLCFRCWLQFEDGWGGLSVLLRKSCGIHPQLEIIRLKGKLKRSFYSVFEARYLQWWLMNKRSPKIGWNTFIVFISLFTYYHNVNRQCICLFAVLISSSKYPKQNAREYKQNRINLTQQLRMNRVLY